MEVNVLILCNLSANFTRRILISLEQLTDIVGFRVILKNINDCYVTLGVFHNKYSMIPGKFKDYISTPKINQYKSIHTSVIGPLKKRIEIQIRTESMHEFAERGIASHWKYKSSEKFSEQIGRAHV